MDNKCERYPEKLTVRHKTTIEIPAKIIRGASCIMPSLEEVADPSNPARAGIVRHGGVSEIVNHVPRRYKHSCSMHLRHHLQTLNRPEQQARRTFLLLGARNAFQNLLLPLWINGQLICRPDEPWSVASYTALCKLASGRLVIQKIRFQEAGRGIDAIGEHDEPVQWAVVAQPLLFRGEIPPIWLLAAMTYDQRHLFHLLWESWQIELFPEFIWHKEVHDELMDAFMRLLSQDVKVRGSALVEIAARRAVQLEEGYLHSSLGLTKNGSVISVMMSGSLHDHGRIQRELGAESAVLLDNGGSVSAAYWPAKHWDADALLSGDPPHPAFFGGGTYFRDAALTTLLFELNSDILEEPFCARPPGDEPWTQW
jgi:hypothetical protein